MFMIMSYYHVDRSDLLRSRSMLFVVSSFLVWDRRYHWISVRLHWVLVVLQLLFICVGGDDWWWMQLVNVISFCNKHCFNSNFWQSDSNAKKKNCCTNKPLWHKKLCIIVKNTKKQYIKIIIKYKGESTCKINSWL